MRRKNQNSILLLTTLGVYLSLLVVGGSAPQTFSHSATSRNFDIAEEQEYRDGLDDNPSDLAALPALGADEEHAASLTAAVRAFFAVFATNLTDIVAGANTPTEFGIRPILTRKIAEHPNFSAADVRSQKIIPILNLARASIRATVRNFAA